jgi:UDP-N-acetylmuramoyl-L-alanyl-D-glutamate--2,6-diaminopimelate ligase
MKTLADLLENLAMDRFIVPESGDSATPVLGIVNDSRQVKPGFLFVAVRGGRLDGHRFLPQAEASGASALVVEDATAVATARVPVIVVPDSAFAYSLLLENFYDYPARSLRLLGVTGTNGKTSTAYILRELLKAFGKRCGLISTVEYDNGRDCVIAERTTPEPAILQRLFREMVDHGCEYAVMEVSSHSLSQSRTGSARFAGTVFTNLTGDHLDYHGDMESYFQAKRRLFLDLLAPDGIMSVNLDDPYGARLFEEFRDARRCFGYGRGTDAFTPIRRTASTLDGTEMDLTVAGHVLSATTNLIGEFNAYNIAGAATLAIGLNLAPPEEIFRMFGHRRISVPGRLESYGLPNGARAFIDYAHTDDALEKALVALRPVTPGVLVVVFGCGGDRDRTKRPRMGRVAASLADRIVVTSDNPRSEEPDAIIADILTGSPDVARDRTKVISDRTEAVRAALAGRSPGDAVLIAGKGHENYQEIAGRRIDYTDQSVVRAFCNGNSEHGNWGE